MFVQVQLYIKIFKRIFMYAMEKGNHDKITHDARLQQENLDEEILFDPGRFKTNFQVNIRKECCPAARI